MTRTVDVTRCGWCGTAPDYVAYHDLEWGVPVTDERGLFERLCLEGFQSGLSWLTILRRRDGFRRAFHGFDPERVAAMTNGDVERLLADALIIRHRGKIEATVGNARAVLAMRGSGASLIDLFWSCAEIVDDRGGDGPAGTGDVPSRSDLSIDLSKRLRSLGFRFVGPTTVYAAMQAVGVVNDHLADCFRRDECWRLRADWLATRVRKRSPMPSNPQPDLGARESARGLSADRADG